MKYEKREKKDLSKSIGRYRITCKALGIPHTDKGRDRFKDLKLLKKKYK